MRRFSIFAIYFLGASLLLPSAANAYIDPGTGSILLQAIVGSIAAGGAVLGIYWHKVKTFFAKDKAPTGRDDGEKDPA
jgi:hypothetical protein